MSASRTPHEKYLESGFYLHPEPIVPPSLLRQAVERIPAILREEYDLGFPPWRRWNVGDPLKVQKVDQVHVCDRVFRLLAIQSILGEWIARVTGADFVQLWATQLFLKPPGGGDLGAIGWHTDRENWRFWEGEVLTVWLALEEVGPDAGPLLYVEGSHAWTDAEKEGDAYDQDLSGLQGRLRQRSPSREWREVPVVLPAGGVAFHSADTLHGSGENRTDRPRIGLALNVRTGRSRIKPGVEHYGYATHLEHPLFSPILYSRRPDTHSAGRPNEP